MVGIRLQSGGSKREGVTTQDLEDFSEALPLLYAELLREQPNARLLRALEEIQKLNLNCLSAESRMLLGESLRSLTSTAHRALSELQRQD